MGGCASAPLIGSKARKSEDMDRLGTSRTVGPRPQSHRQLQPGIPQENSKRSTADTIAAAFVARAGFEAESVKGLSMRGGASWHSDADGGRRSSTQAARLGLAPAPAAESVTDLCSFHSGVLATTDDKRDPKPSVQRATPDGTASDNSFEASRAETVRRLEMLQRSFRSHAWGTANEGPDPAGDAATAATSTGGRGPETSTRGAVGAGDASSRVRESGPTSCTGAAGGAGGGSGAAGSVRDRQTAAAGLDAGGGVSGGMAENGDGSLASADERGGGGEGGGGGGGCAGREGYGAEAGVRRSTTESGLMGRLALGGGGDGGGSDCGDGGELELDLSCLHPSPADLRAPTSTAIISASTPRRHSTLTTASASASGPQTPRHGSVTFPITATTIPAAAATAASLAAAEAGVAALSVVSAAAAAAAASRAAGKDAIPAGGPETDELTSLPNLIRSSGRDTLSPDRYRSMGHRYSDKAYYSGRPGDSVELGRASESCGRNSDLGFYMEEARLSTASSLIHSGTSAALPPPPPSRRGAEPVRHNLLDTRLGQLRAARETEPGPQREPVVLEYVPVLKATPSRGNLLLAQPSQKQLQWGTGADDSGGGGEDGANRMEYRPTKSFCRRVTSAAVSLASGFAASPSLLLPTSPLLGGGTRGAASPAILASPATTASGVTSAAVERRGMACDSDRYHNIAAGAPPPQSLSAVPPYTPSPAGGRIRGGGGGGIESGVVCTEPRVTFASASQVHFGPAELLPGPQSLLRGVNWNDLSPRQTRHRIMGVTAAATVAAAGGAAASPASPSGLTPAQPLPSSSPLPLAHQPSAPQPSLGAGAAVRTQPNHHHNHHHRLRHQSHSQRDLALGGGGGVTHGPAFSGTGRRAARTALGGVAWADGGESGASGRELAVASPSSPAMPAPAPKGPSGYGGEAATAAAAAGTAATATAAVDWRSRRRDGDVKSAPGVHVLGSAAAAAGDGGGGGGGGAGEGGRAAQRAARLLASLHRLGITPAGQELPQTPQQ